MPVYGPQLAHGSNKITKIPNVAQNKQGRTSFNNNKYIIKIK
jgi:hypothetical protein